jgi:hypothetical protein
MRAASKAMNEVVGRPRAGELEVALAHHRAGGRKLVLVALNAFAVDQVGNVQQHLAAFGHAAADFFIQRRKHPMHLEAHGAGAGLAFALAGGVLTQVGQVFFADAFEGQVFLEFLGAAGVYVDFEVHLGLAVKAFEIALKLPLIRPDRLTEAFVVLKDGAKPERKNGGVLEAIGDNSGVVDSSFLIEVFGWVVFTDHNS